MHELWRILTQSTSKTYQKMFHPSVPSTIPLWCGESEKSQCKCPWQQRNRNFRWLLLSFFFPPPRNISFGLSNRFNVEFPTQLISKIAPEEYCATIMRINSILKVRVCLCVQLNDRLRLYFISLPTEKFANKFEMVINATARVSQHVYNLTISRFAYR